jgi:hypothetical protein
MPLYRSFYAFGNFNLNIIKNKKVDESKPKTTIRIRLHNGETTMLTINTDERVNRLFEFVMRYANKNN